MKKKMLILIVILLVFLVGFTCFVFKKGNKNIIKTYGNVEIRQVDISFQISGVISDVFKEEGDYVHQGELLAQIDNKDYVANYQKALAEEKSFLAQSKDDFLKYKRNLPLCSDDTISKQECDNLLNKKDFSLGKYEQSKANRIFQKNQLDYTKIYAPQDGIITTRAQEKGARINAGQIVYVLSLHKPIWIRTYIKETDLGKIKYGKKATIITDTIDNTGQKRKYKGYIGYISPVAEFTPKTVQTEDLRTDLVYRIRVYIDEVDEYLRQGMPVSVEINLSEE